LRGSLYGCIEAVAGSDYEHLAAISGCAFHTRAICKRRRHRLFDQHMLSGSQSCDRLLGMQLMRGGYVNRIDIRRMQERVERVERWRAEFVREAFSSFAAQVESPGKRYARIGLQRGHSEHETPAEPNNS
jgi:hypothetical protein